jgi:hypothetical protein
MVWRNAKALSRGPYFWLAMLPIAVVAAWVAGCGSGISGYMASRYWPLYAGDHWVFNLTRADNSTGIAEMRTGSIETFLGVPAYRQTKFESAQETMRFWIPSDVGNGIRFLGAETISPIVGTINFNPALLIPNDLEQGVEHVSTASATGTVQGGGTPASATLRATLLGMERITVPTGTYDALKLDVSQQVLDSNSQEVSFGHEGERTWWVVRDIGLVKATEPSGRRIELQQAFINGVSIP